MADLASVQAVAESSAEQTAAAAATPPPPQWMYSIRSFFEWHQEVIKNAFGWSVKNSSSLLTGLAGLAVTTGVSFLLLLLIRKVIVPFLEKKYHNASMVLSAISGPLVRLAFWTGFSISADFVPFTKDVHEFLDMMFYVCFVLALINIVQRSLQCSATIMHTRFQRKDPENYNMNKLLLDLSVSIIRLAVWVYAIGFILQEVLHWNVTHLIASAGIVGLGVAFAAKDTFANIFGAFSILGGKMFKVGDWIRVGSTDGTVERIGFRSIRIRALDDGRLIDIPNHLIADVQIENISSHLFWREHFCFGLVYQTTPEQMELAKKILLEIGEDLAELINQHHRMQFDFMLFDDSSLNLDGFVWFKATNLMGMRRARGRFNEEVLKRFTAAGLDIAYPTRTVFMENVAQK